MSDIEQYLVSFVDIDRTIISRSYIISLLSLFDIIDGIEGHGGAFVTVSRASDCTLIYEDGFFCEHQLLLDLSLL